MLKIRLIAVGKIRESYLKEGISEYAKRISRYAELQIREVKEETFSKEGEAERRAAKKKEGERILAELKGAVVCLSAEGKKFSSEQFSRYLVQTGDRVGEISFVIGGSYGLDDAVKARADLVLSFSDMIFPHGLMRLIFTEQLYRAFTIAEGGNYHK